MTSSSSVFALSSNFRMFTDQCRRVMSRLIRSAQQRLLLDGYDIDMHLSPRYDPWDQRLCAVPDGYLFHALHRRTACIVTDRIVRFTADGLALKSGQQLPADVVVTATGLTMLAFGGRHLVVDETPWRFRRRSRQGQMLGGVPNFAYPIGYTNSSWTFQDRPRSRAPLPGA